MTLVKKTMEFGHGISVSLTRHQDDPFFSIFDPSDTTFEVPEGFDVVIFLVPDAKSALKLAAKLEGIVIALKHEAKKSL
jgi:hypothetical protein